MSKLTNFGTNVANNFNTTGGKQEVFIDPATILTFVSLVTELVKLLKGCKKSPEDVVETAARPSFADTHRLKAAVRRKIGFVQYWFHGDKIVAEVLKEAKKQSIEDIQEMYEEV